MHHWETVRRTIVFFFNLYTLNILARGFTETNTSQPPTIRTLISGITRFDQKLYFIWSKALLYFEITSISGKSVGRTQECYFRYYRCPEQLTFKKMKWFWKLILLSILSPTMRRFLQIFFYVVDRYVQQIDRAMKTFYNFCNFDISGIVQFKFNSPFVLLHILSQSTCLNRLISIEYKNKWNILITSNLSCTSDTFWPILENRLSR